MSWESDKQQFDTAAHQARAGLITQDQFLRRTARAWEAAASKLWERWRRRLPDSIEREDILQELRIQACQHLGRFEEGRGASIGAFVFWSSCSRTKRQIHRWRGALLSGNEAKNPSRAELSFARIDAGAAESRWAYERPDHSFQDRLVAPFEAPEEELDRQERYAEALRACRTLQEAIVWQALKAAGGSVVDAAESIWENFRARIGCGLSSQEEAHELVGVTIRRVAGQLERDAEDQAANAA